MSECIQCGKGANVFFNGECPECLRERINKRKSDDKLRWSLLPWREVEQVVKLLTDGTKDHADEGWKTEDQTSHFEALMRHLRAWHRGETKDAGTGASPLVLVAARALFLLWHENERKL